MKHFYWKLQYARQWAEILMNMLGKQCTEQNESDKVVMAGMIINITFLKF